MLNKIDITHYIKNPIYILFSQYPFDSRAVSSYKPLNFRENRGYSKQLVNSFIVDSIIITNQMVVVKLVGVGTCKKKFFKI